MLKLIIILGEEMSKEIKEFFSTYTDFVTKVTSDPSIDLDALKNSFDDIESSYSQYHQNCS